MPFLPQRRHWQLLIAIVAAAAVITAVVAKFRVPDEERFQTALKALLSGDVNGAAAELDRFSSDKASLPHRRLLRGGVLLRSGNAEDAHKWLAAVDSEGELRNPALLLLGECYYRLKRLAEAELCFLQLIEGEPDHPDAHRWLGSIYYDLGAMHQAIEQIERVIRLDPDDFRTHHLLGVISYDVEKYTQAIDSFRAAIERNPPDNLRHTLQLDLARALVKNRRFKEAKACLDPANDPESYAVRAECAFGEGDIGTASQLVEQCLIEDPGNRTALMLIARIREQEQLWAKSNQPLQRLLAADPHDHEARYLLAMNLARVGNDDRSRKEMQRMEDSLALRKRATELYIQAIQKPTTPEYRDDLAAICDELDKPRLAVMWRQAAQALRVRQQIVGQRNKPPSSE